MTEEPGKVTTDRTERVIRLDEQVKGIEDKVDKILGHLEGNGRVGIIVRVDRMEQIINGQVWLARAMGGAMAVLVVGLAWQIVRGWRP